MRLAALLMAVACLLASVSAKVDPEVQELQKELEAKKTVLHGLSKIPAAHTVAQAAAHHKVLGDQALQTSLSPRVKHSPLIALKSQGDDSSLLKETIDDNQVGDFSKSHNKHDHRMMNGKFDWLLKASSPLYSAAKVVAGTAQHTLANVLHSNAHVSGSSLQAEGNTTDTSDEGASADLENVKKENAANETKFLEFSKDTEGYFFLAWIGVLLGIILILVLCIVVCGGKDAYAYGRKCLGYPDADEQQATGKYRAMP